MSFGHPFYKSIYQYWSVAKHKLIGPKAKNAANRADTSLRWTTVPPHAAAKPGWNLLKTGKRLGPGQQRRLYLTYFPLWHCEHNTGAFITA